MSVLKISPESLKRKYELELKNKVALFEFQRKRIPYYMQDSIVNYIVNGYAPGDFLTGIISNDLKKACWHADADNLWLIPVYASFFYHHAPMHCWGSIENMNSWLEQGGIE